MHISDFRKFLRCPKMYQFSLKDNKRPFPFFNINIDPNFKVADMTENELLKIEKIAYSTKQYMEVVQKIDDIDDKKNIYFDGKKSIKRGAALTLLSLSLCIVSMLYMPRGIRLPGIYYRCLGVYTANPYWNATTLAARPFAVIAFFQFWRIFYEKKQVVSEYVIFSASLLLSTMTKPSFTLPFIAMCGVVICADIFKSRFGNLKKDVVIGVLFIPTFVDMLYQYVQVFRGSEGGGMGIGIARVWSRYCGNIPLAILLAMAFPIVLTLVARFCKWEGRFGSMLATGWLFYVINLIMALFLYEKGYREYDFNFSWGYMYGIFFAFVIGVFALTEQYDRIREKKIEARRSLIGIYLSTAIYAIHLICGIIYLADMLRGGTYN